MYTVSQEGTLCVWESDTELEGLKKGPKYSERKKMEEEKKNREEGEGNKDDDDVEIIGEDGETRGDVIKGSTDTPKQVEGIKNVRYSQRSKWVFPPLKISLFLQSVSLFLRRIHTMISVLVMKHGKSSHFSVITLH